MNVYLIRHGKTAGNLEKRYIGRTDEPLCEAGIRELESISYPPCDLLVCSPMLRCMQTAELLFPGQPYTICDDLRECDFGRWEGKNYLDLTGDPDYQKWIDSGGALPFPGGESPEQFRERCVRGFLSVMTAADVHSVAFVVHGGTVMSVLDALCVPHLDYYDWSPENGRGWRCFYTDGLLAFPEKL